MNLVVRWLWPIRAGLVFAMLLGGGSGCRKKADKKSPPKQTSSAVMLTPSMDSPPTMKRPVAMRVPMALAQPTVDAGVKKPEKVPCGLPWGLRSGDTERVVRQKLKALGMQLKPNRRFGPEAIFDRTFAKGSYEIEAQGRRKGRLSSIWVSKDALSRRSSAMWYYRGFRRAADKAWREKPWIGKPPDVPSPESTLSEVTRWRCGTRRKWTVSLTWSSRDGGPPHSVGVSWVYGPRPSRKPSAAYLAAKKRCKAIPGLTGATLRTKLLGRHSSTWRLTRREIQFLYLFKNNKFIVNQIVDRIEYPGRFKVSGSLLTLRWKSNMWNDEKIRTRRYELKKCSPGGLCLVRQDNPRFGIFACHAKYLSGFDVNE